jgi:hypothetical protein
MHYSIIWPDDPCPPDDDDIAEEILFAALETMDDGKF